MRFRSGRQLKIPTRAPSLRLSQAFNIRMEANEVSLAQAKEQSTAQVTAPGNPSELHTDAPSGTSTSSADAKTRATTERPNPYAHLNVAPKWREIQGEKNWNNLLDPLDPALRGEIVRYGDFITGAYAAFDGHKQSKYIGSSKYSRRRFMSKVGLGNRGYEVTDYIYATAGHDHPVAKFLSKIDFNDFDHELEDMWDTETNWVGFVAVCTDPKEIARLGRRDIVIVWRGTQSNLEWLEMFRNYTVPTGLDPREAGRGRVDLKVEAGFLYLYTNKNEKSSYSKKSARELVLAAVQRLVQQYRFEELSITVTGHSLGSSLAKLCAYDIAESGINKRLKTPGADEDKIPEWGDPTGLGTLRAKLADMGTESQFGPIPVTVISFGGPRLGNDSFRDRMEELGVKVLRIVSPHDKVAKIPGIIFNEKLQVVERLLKPVWRFVDSLPWTYSHVGAKLEVDGLRSPFLRPAKDTDSAHNLEGYLHLVSGDHGPNGEFKLAIARDIALVNKHSGYLKAQYLIPEAWLQEENKGLFLSDDGTWKMRTRDHEDLPENQ